MLREIEERRSIRKYDTAPIAKDVLEDILASAVLAPSAKNRPLSEIFGELVKRGIQYESCGEFCE